MSLVRLIARLDVKGPNLVKGIQMEGLRKLGDPCIFASKYYRQGIDEILYVDIVASLYERANILDMVRRTTHDVFVPITVGGGLRTLSDAQMALRAGADKVAINTAALRNPTLLSEVATRFGSQCMVLSIEAKRIGPDRWEAYCDYGREKTGIDVVEWARRGVELGAGEILLTSVDQEGTGKGFDIDLCQAVTSAVNVPVIVSGGIGNPEHVVSAVSQGAVSAVAIARYLHYGDQLALQGLRHACSERGVQMRR